MRREALDCERTGHEDARGVLVGLVVEQLGIGVAAGDIPVVGWGNSVDTANEVSEGYVNAAMWSDPQAISYLGLTMGLMAASDIPPGFDIRTGTLYEADTADYYLKIMEGK